MAGLVEYIDAATEGPPIYFRYVPVASDAILKGSHFDLVIASDLMSAALSSYLAPLADDVVETFAASAPYPAFESVGSATDGGRLIPVAFELPTIVTRRRAGRTPPYYIDVTELRKLSELFNDDRGRARTLGLSPRWHPHFPLWVAEAFGADFRDGLSGTPTWQAANLDRAVSFLAEWDEIGNGGLVRVERFSETYLLEPPLNLVREGRIGVVPMTSGEYFALPYEIRREVDFRWLSSNGEVRVLDDVVCAAISADASDNPAAHAVLRMLADADAVTQIIENAREERLGAFGLLGGFSVFEAANVATLPTSFPSLLGRLPAADRIDSPKVLPVGWRLMTEEVIVPWFRTQIANPSPQNALRTRLDEWVRQTGYLADVDADRSE